MCILGEFGLIATDVVAQCYGADDVEQDERYIDSVDIRLSRDQKQQPESLLEILTRRGRQLFENGIIPLHKA